MEKTGHTWVTRRGVKVDRICSAWLIRRFLDDEAELKLIDPESYRPRPGERRFDMPGGEYTHEGERCTFEVLMERFGLVDSALDHIAEIVHDLDLRDSKYQRPDPFGLGAHLGDLIGANADDETRLARGAELLDQMYEAFAPHRFREDSSHLSV